MASLFTYIHKTLEFEGGYVNDPDDPGGETKFGISKRAHPSVDIKNLTIEQARAIYKSQYWDRYDYGKIKHDLIAWKVFDITVNAGAKRAGKIVQRALNRIPGITVVVDGAIGPITRTAIAIANPTQLLEFIRDEHRAFYLRLIERKPVMAKYKRGWLRRAAA